MLLPLLNIVVLDLTTTSAWLEPYGSGPLSLPEPYGYAHSTLKDSAEQEPRVVKERSR